MKKYKKILAVLLGSAMAVSMAACGGSGGSTDSSSDDSSSGDKVSITFWHAMGGVNGEATQKLVDDFNASQDDIRELMMIRSQN